MPALPRTPSALVAGAVLALALLAGCSGDDEAPVGHVPTPLPSYDADGVLLERADFCAQVPGAAVEASVGEIESTDHHGNGDQVTLPDGSPGVSHEFGCTWTGTDGAVASGWVFAPPVPPERAEQLLAERSVERKGCTTISGGGFGDPATGSMCRTDDATVVTYAGLFVDSWLACSLSLPDPGADPDLAQAAAGEWCVEVASAATAG